MTEKTVRELVDARVNSRAEATPTIGVACLARTTFAVEYAQQIAARALQALGGLGWPVVGDATLLMDAQAARKAGALQRAASPDLLVLVCATFADASAAVEIAAEVGASVCLWALREPGPVGDRLALNSLCGATIASHALKREGHAVEYVYGDPGEPEVLDQIAVLARAAATRTRLRHSRIGLVGQAPTGFYGCQFDELELLRVIGTSVAQVDLATVFAAAARAPEAEVTAAVASTAARSPSLGVLPTEDVGRFGAAYVALREVLRERELDGLAVRCWPEFPTSFALMPCATLGRLADDGFVCACEADMHGAVTLLALQWLAGAAPLLADIVAMDRGADTVALWHCGNAPACLAREGEEPLLTTHCNRGIGVAGNFAVRPSGSGRATLARLGVGPGGSGGYRLLVAAGELLDTAENRFKGNTAQFRPTGGAARLLDTIFDGGWEHHVAFVHRNVSRELAALARLLGIEMVAV